MNTSLSPLFLAKTFVLIAGSALLLGATQVARAADAAAATPPSAALATPAPRKEARAPVAAPDPAGTAVAKKGEPLQKLIARSLGNLPFKPEILRDAMIQKNPAAFKNGKPESLIVGSVLQLPTMGDFRRFIPAVAAVCVEGEGTDGGARADAAADPRKGWVRLP